MLDKSFLKRRCDIYIERDYALVKACRYNTTTMHPPGLSSSLLAPFSRMRVSPAVDCEQSVSFARKSVSDCNM